MSKFKRYSTSSLYNSIFNIFKDITEKIQEKWGDIDKAINNILNKI